MDDPAKLRRQARDCRAAAKNGKRREPSFYLLDLARHYDERAAEIEMQRAEQKPITDRRPAS